MMASRSEKRSKALQDAIKAIQANKPRDITPNREWWLGNTGRFANDPSFEDMVRKTREYRKSLELP